MRIAAQRTQSSQIALEDLGPAVIKRIEASLEKKVSPMVREKIDQIIGTWEHKPDIRQKIRKRGTEIQLYVYPTGENAKIWHYVSRGTKPHPITPKKPGGVLAFPWAGQPGLYNPKTQPKGTLTSGAGIQTSDQTMHYFQHVDHPGTKPRHFEERIAADPLLKLHFRKTIRDAIQEARMQRWRTGKW